MLSNTLESECSAALTSRRDRARYQQPAWSGPLFDRGHCCVTEIFKSCQQPILESPLRFFTFYVLQHVGGIDRGLNQMALLPTISVHRGEGGMEVDFISEILQPSSPLATGAGQSKI